MKVKNSLAVISGAILIGVSLSVTSFSKAPRQPVSSGKEEKPTIVLVHGAFADGSSWNKVIPLLQEKGYRTIAVQNPLTSLNDDVAFVERAIAEAPGKVILVGHSWGGVVITQAGNNEKVKSLVEENIEKSILGPSVVNVLKLNIGLDDLK